MEEAMIAKVIRELKSLILGLRFFQKLDTFFQHRWSLTTGSIILNGVGLFFFAGKPVFQDGWSHASGFSRQASLQF